MTPRDVSAAQETPMTVTGGSLRSVEIEGPCGRLEGLWNEGAQDASYAALVCHPHPLGGGNLHNKVVYHAMKVLNDPAWGLGLPTLRFNFRGTGRSEGRHDGLDESRDVLAALDWLGGERGLPIALVGYSFGAAMALKAAWERSGEGESRTKIAALALIGFPVCEEFPDLQNPEWLQTPLPKLFLSGDRDQYASKEELEKTATKAAEPKRLTVVSGADHFFTGRIEAMQTSLHGWLKEYLP
jgi:alpha/beta superfamily hydrolase